MNNFILSRQQGVGLIEVLVTVFLLATTLLALAALQARSLQFNQGAYFRSQANIFAYDILDRIRINRDNLNSYNITANASAPSGSSLAAVDLNEWKTDVQTKLPNGQGSIACDGNFVCTVTISWDELNSSGQASEDTSTFSYSARI